MIERIERNFKGHLCVAEDCGWFRTTDVGKFRISSIGDYRSSRDPKVMTKIGCDRFFETMVFGLSDDICPCGCGAPEIQDYTELDSEGYNTQADAEAGHERMVERYATDAGLISSGKVENA